MTSPTPTSLSGARSAPPIETSISEVIILHFPDTLLERYMTRVQGWVRSWACGRLTWHDLLDAEQEVFCALLKELGRCDPERPQPTEEEHLPRFLHQVLHRRFLNSQRSARRFARRQEHLAAAVRRSLRLDMRDPAQLLEEAECVACLHTAISDLKPLEYCLCVGFLAEAPLAVTARQLGLRYAVARRCWHGTLAKLRARLAGWR
jgi:RNA polymerase sigma factor (sigma-70 family)